MQVFIGLDPDLMPFLGFIQGGKAFKSCEDRLHKNKLFAAIEGRLCQNCCHQQAQAIQKNGNKKPLHKRLFAEDFFWFFDRFAGIYEQFDGFTNG